MEKKPDDHIIRLSESDTEILTRALAEAAKEKPAPRKVPHTEFRKKQKPVLPSGKDTEFLF